MSDPVIDDAVALLRDFAVWCRWLDASVVDGAVDADRVAAVAGSPPIDPSHVRVFAEDKSGSIYVVDRSTGAVRFLGSEGERLTVTADIADFLALIALGFTPASFASGSRTPVRSPNRAMLDALRTRFGLTVAASDLDAIAERASRIVVEI